MLIAAPEREIVVLHTFCVIERKTEEESKRSRNKKPRNSSRYFLNRSHVNIDLSLASTRFFFKINVDLANIYIQ